MNKQKIFKQSRGITLIALIITIVVLLILAVVTINAVRDGGIIGIAKKATKEHKKAEEKEKVMLAALNSKLENQGEVNKVGLQAKLPNEDIYDLGETFEVYFDDTKTCYTLDKKGNIIDTYVVEEITNAGDSTKGNTLDGSENNPYEISCIEDLLNLSQKANKNGFENGKNYILKRNLDFKSPFSYANSQRTDYGDINKDGTTEILIEEMRKGNGFASIGLGGYSVTINFDGKGFEIRNIYSCSESGANGLFGWIVNSKITNLGVSGEIKATGAGNAVHCGVAGIVAVSSTTTIENCYNKCKVISEQTSAGGIVGYLSNITIVNCYNLGEIEGVNARRYNWAFTW